MDWYFGNGIDDLVVPNDGGSDRLPSPDSWSKWGISASECFPNKCFSMYSQFNKELNISSGKGLFDEGEMGTSANDRDLSSSSSVCEGLSEDSLQKTSLSYNRAYNQLEDLAGLQQMDDIFLSSLLDDLPGAENVHKSFYFRSDSSGMLASDSISTSMNLESQSISSSVHSAGSSKYLKTHAFSPELGSEKGHTTTSQFSPCNSEQKDSPPVKAQTVRLMSPSEQGCMPSGVDEETSVEESVLQELEMVMTQLTKKTRICFRDALYRLADNSKGNPVSQSQDGDLAVEELSSWAAHDETTRSESKEGTESETNTIDRAIANLMFNEIDFNAQDLSGGSSSDSKHEINGVSGQQQSDNPCRLQISHSHHNSVLPHDAEVPILGHRDVHKSFATSNAGGKRKTPLSEFGSATEF
ncbi:protein LNK3-like isoform X1 [Rosa rugosa]|uniref:protein LNK3-like isoform X1 n=1 Tax=Rosa rugosa TaxID=74645 RepID=UPI002B409616|nr:protein LNK3-like isoform X1 [Rosa rugosa]